MAIHENNSLEKSLFAAVSEEECATVSGGVDGIQPGSGSNVPGKDIPEFNEIKLYATTPLPFLISVYVDKATGQARVMIRENR
ncbi:hypothetical protein [Iningainema tapete]|uniref:Uncharacterized protein n=1 Tax=Iningainema tapete BLCC-T55 TaxID=2748662 RepID=A0A8J6XGF3_9CYAN|nr:hypothetical protein [Iningainema tapete]MBD2771506.1 hypothetical protein [Iningainema tapete BLCC-T55]